MHKIGNLQWLYTTLKLFRSLVFFNWRNFLISKVTKTHSVSSSILNHFPILTCAAMGFQAERADRGKGVNITPCLTREQAAKATWARRQSRALNRYFVEGFWKFYLKGLMTDQCQVIVKIVTFRTISYRSRTYNSCEPKPFQNVSPGMKKASAKYRPSTKQS